MNRSVLTVGPAMDMPIMHDSDRYELVRDIGSGNFGVARLMRDKQTGELVAVKYIERGEKTDENVQREIINHRSLRHPNIVRFKEIADVWSCGVTLYVMLVGAYPFEDPGEPKNFLKDNTCNFLNRIFYRNLVAMILKSKVFPLVQRIRNVQYSIPDYVHISPDCRHLISRIFVAEPEKRITIPEIRNHEWFLKNLPADLMVENTMNNQFEEPDQAMQSLDEIMQIIAEAKIPAAGANSLNQYLAGSLDIDNMEEDLESDPDIDTDSSGEIVYAI